MIVKILTNIDSKYNTFIEDEAKKRNTTKRKIIESAIDIYIQQTKKKDIEDQYSKMANDKEYIDEMKGNSEYLGCL